MKSSKVINLNSFGCGLNTQKNAPSKAKSRTVRKADQPAELHGNNFHSVELTIIFPGY